VESPLSPLLVLLGLASTSARAEVLRHALVVGSNAPSAELAPLRYAEDDAQRVAALLIELGGFPADEVTLLRSPTAEQLRAALDMHEHIAEDTGEDLFLFYYSGHADEQGLRLGEGQISFDELRGDLRDMPAEVRLGVLDACRSGEITRLKGLAITAPFLDQDDLTAEGEAWLTASSADESAQESDRLQGSFFTHYLISGLRGAADKGDGVVSLDEAYAYAYDRTVVRTGGTTGGTQHPAYDFRIQGKGDLPLTDVRRASARLRLPADLAGVVTVLREPEDVPVAEVSKAEGKETVLALPPGTYRLQLRAGGTIQEGRLGLSEGADLLVPAMAFRSPEAQVAAKGSAATSPPGPVAAGAAGAAGATEGGATRSAEAPAGWKRVDGTHGDFQPHHILNQAAEKTGQLATNLGNHLMDLGRRGDAAGQEPAAPESTAPESSAPESSAPESSAPESTAPESTAPESTAPETADAQEPALLAIPADQPQPPPPGRPESADSPERPGSAAPLAPALQPRADNLAPVSSVAGDTVDSSMSLHRGPDLRHSPVIAATASALLPGAGQAYNGQWAKAGLALGSWAIATGGTLSIQRSMGNDLPGWGGMLFTGPTPGLMLAQGIRGWATADGWQHIKQEQERPVTGLVLGYGTAWHTADGKADAVLGDLAIASTGLTLDWVMEPGFSLGIDRTGYLRRPDGTVIVNTGTKMSFALLERSRLRPALFVYGGLEMDTRSQALVPVKGLVGGGADLKWYMTPRYFVELEGRGGLYDNQMRWSTGGGLGMHFGHPGQGRPVRGGKQSPEDGAPADPASLEDVQVDAQG